MSNLDDLRARLFCGLALALEREHPNAVERFRALPHEISQLQGWCENLDFPPPEPWTSAISGLHATSLGLEQLEFVLESLRTASTGRAVFFFETITPLVIMTCLEPFGFVVAKLARSKSPIVDKDTAASIRATISLIAKEPRFRPLRDFAGHGPHIGLETGGWLDTSRRNRHLEAMALNGEDGAKLLEAFFAFDPSRRDARYISTARLVRGTTSFIEARARQLLDAIDKASDKPSGPRKSPPEDSN